MTVNTRKLRRGPGGSHGQGVFACEPIARGEAVVTMAGPRLTAAQATDDVRCVQVGPDEFLGESGGPDDYINHSCEPNLAFTDGSLTLYALRDIAPGDELLWDYSTAMNEPGWSFPCRCGAGRCRGRVVSFCDLPEPTRRALAPWLLAYLRGP